MRAFPASPATGIFVCLPVRVIIYTNRLHKLILRPGVGVKYGHCRLPACQILPLANDPHASERANAGSTQSELDSHIGEKIKQIPPRVSRTPSQGNGGGGRFAVSSRDSLQIAFQSDTVGEHEHRKERSTAGEGGFDRIEHAGECESIACPCQAG